MKTIIGFFGSKLIAGVAALLLALALASMATAFVLNMRLDLANAKVESIAKDRDTAMNAATSAVGSANIFKGLLEKCTGERARVKGENANAVRAAYLKGQKEAKSQEDFNKRLANSKPDCEAIKRAVVCPSLRDY